MKNILKITKVGEDVKQPERSYTTGGSFNGHKEFGKLYLLKTNVCTSYDSSLYITVCLYSPKEMFKSVQGSTIHSRPKLEITQEPIKSIYHFSAFWLRSSVKST